MARPYLSPGRPVVELKIGSESVSVVPDFLESFSHDVFANGIAGQATITLFDPTYEYLENLILAHHDSVQFRYGWYADASATKASLTPWRNGVIWKYTPRFSEQGLHIDINIADTPLVASLTEQDIVYTLGGDSQFLSVSDLVKLICEIELGLEYTVEETEPMTTTITRNKMSAPQFIATVLCSMAKSMTGRGGYRFWVDENNVAHFESSDPKVLKKLFVFGKGQDSEVISFSPSYDGMQALASGAGDMLAVGYDELTRTTTTKRYDPVASTGARRPTPAERASIMVSGKFGQTTPTPTAPYVAGRIYYLPFATKELVDAWALHKHTIARNLFVKAEMVVLGDVQLFPMDAVGVQIVKRTDGKNHYLSGYYLIQSVSHKIINGMFTTTLSLTSTGIGSAGDELSGTKVRFASTPTTPETPGKAIKSTPER